MRVAAITLTKGGIQLAKRLRTYNSEIDIFTQEKYDSEHVQIIQLPLRDHMKELIENYDMLLFIMATGIVVRLIAPFIKHKSIDPGIIVMDEEGKYVISLLSGHLGGANAYTHKLADFLHASPVITTASDVKKTIAVDMLAMELGCYIENFDDTKEVTGHIVNGDNIGIISDIPILIDLPQQFIIISDRNIEQYVKKYTIKSMIIISTKKIEVDCPTVYLYKKILQLEWDARGVKPRKSCCKH